MVGLKKLLRIIRRNWRMAVVVIILMTICGYVLAAYGLQKHYITTAEIYIESTDGTSSSEKAETCALLFTSPQMYNVVNSTLVSGFSYAEFDRMVSINKKNGTQILEISTDCDNSDASYKLMTKFLDLMPSVVDSYRAEAKITVMRDPVQPSEPSFPDEKMFTIMGAVFGTVLSVLAILLIWRLDNSITAEDDLTQMYNIPVLGEIPDFDREVDYLGR